MKKTGLLGGTFDPPTIAHLVAAEWALGLLELDQVRFVLARHNPHKTDIITTPDNIRLEMLEIAIKDNPRFAVETCELEREAPSYTIDTINYLTTEYPDVEFTLLIGADVLNSFHQWKEPEMILEKVSVTVFNREGYEFNEHANQWLNRIQLIDIPRLKISSTMIRDRIQKRKSISDLVISDVETIIRKQKLYKNDCT
ncbi:MAG: nicotinate-nucleotide adenylyltransferase [Candidatus Electryonea clarkiae]|nr:nicotinate-nucleotide adenylyltransferase [Candidatus Electryonea clarkiae]MDP8286279.1 nicotinate-nucleotide adenylyltransferase [Candidatus Electryonea clarkiae]